MAEKAIRQSCKNSLNWAPIQSGSISKGNKMQEKLTNLPEFQAFIRRFPHILDLPEWLRLKVIYSGGARDWMRKYRDHREARARKQAAIVAAKNASLNLLRGKKYPKHSVKRGETCARFRSASHSHSVDDPEAHISFSTWKAVA